MFVGLTQVAVNQRRFAGSHTLRFRARTAQSESFSN